MDVTADWYVGNWTKADLKEEIGLDYAGPGLYLTETDTVLVIRKDEVDEPLLAAHSPVWQTKYDQPDTRYRVYVWNSPLHCNIMTFALMIPRVLDLRSDV